MHLNECLLDLEQLERLILFHWRWQLSRWCDWLSFPSPKGLILKKTNPLFFCSLIGFGATRGSMLNYSTNYSLAANSIEDTSCLLLSLLITVTHTRSSSAQIFILVAFSYLYSPFAFNLVAVASRLSIRSYQCFHCMLREGLFFPLTFPPAFSSQEPAPCTST